MPLVSSGGGVSQVKDTGHNGMESIGICLSVLTLSIFLVREIRTDKHPHPSPPPRAHTLQSQAQSSHTGQHPATSSYQRHRAQERGEGGRGRKPTLALLPSGPAPTPLLRFLTPKNFRNWDGGCEGKCAACPVPAANPPPESGPRPPLFKGAFCSADEKQQCGSATTRAQGTLRGRREAGLEGAGHSHPFPGWGRTARCGNPAAPDLKGDGCARPLATHLASVAHLPRVCRAGDMQDTRLALPGAAGPQSLLLPPDSPPGKEAHFRRGFPLRPAPWLSRPSIAGRGRSKGVGRE